MLMRITLAVALFFGNSTVFSQSCEDCRYISPVFDSVIVTTVKFGEGPRANGNMQELYMDIYEPYGDTATNRPVAIFAFGGGFVTGSRDDWYVVLVCEHLARAGYVVASIDYRIYDDAGQLALEVLGIPPRHMRIFFRPMQDMRAAVQYLKADYAELGNNYNIDTSRILIGGASSGGITALMVAYCDKESELAELGGGDISPIASLGGFNSTSGLYPNYSWDALGVFQVSGALLATDWIEPGDVPVISAHGNKDNIVPYAEGAFAGLTLGFFNMYGSYLVDSAARANGVCSYLYTMDGKDHPSDTLGIEYIKSVVYRLMLRMHAVINDRSFCCALDLDVQPKDTLFYEPGEGPVSLSATVSNGNGNAAISWCSIDCFGTGRSSSFNVEPMDTNFKYVTCIASEGQCQDVALIMLKEGIPDTNSTSVTGISAAYDWRLYPQPANEFFNIGSSIKAQSITIEIADVAGRILYRENLLPDGELLNGVIDTKSLPAGTYMLSVFADNAVQHTQKLLLVK